MTCFAFVIPYFILYNIYNGSCCEAYEACEASWYSLFNDLKQSKIIEDSIKEISEIKVN